jgi:hypothetical protein
MFNAVLALTGFPPRFDSAHRGTSPERDLGDDQSHRGGSTRCEYGGSKIDTLGNVAGREVGGKVGERAVERKTGRMSDTESAGGDDQFATIDKRNSWRHRQIVDRQSDEKNATGH